MRTALLDITSRCNLTCAHCGVADTYAKNIGVELIGDDIQVILQRLHDAGYRTLWISGGEPLLRRDVVAMVAHAKQLGFQVVRIVSNGTRLTPELAAALVDAGLDEYLVSLDGATAESNDAIRGQGTYDKALAAIDLMIGLRDRLAAKGRRLMVGAQFTMTGTNFHEAEQMVRLAGERRCTWLHVNELRMAGGVRKDPERMIPSMLDTLDAREAVVKASLDYPDLRCAVFGRPRVIAYLNERFGTDLAHGKPTCALVDGYSTVYVEATGLASACSALHLEHGAGGTPEATRLQEHCLDEILAAPRFDPIRTIVDQALSERWQDDFAPCKGCPFLQECTMCPLFLQEQQDKIIHECLLALQRLSRWRKSRQTQAGTGTAGSSATRGRHAS